MKRIGLLSDTHGFLHPRVFDFFVPCDEIWHAGDIGNMTVADQLEQFKPFKAVYGNIDDHQIRTRYPEQLLFNCESVKVFITHIGGYPGRYASGIEERIKKEQPKLFISGHSHILKVMPDHKNGLLHINPGAAGKYGIHKVITLVRFSIIDHQIENLEINEIERNQLA